MLTGMLIAAIGLGIVSYFEDFMPIVILSSHIERLNCNKELKVY